MAKLTATKADGKYAIVEINQMASRTTGAMIADAPLASNFQTVGKESDTQNFAENGMILYFDPTASRTDGDKNGKGAFVGTGKAGLSYGLVYSTEHLYDTYNKDLASFKMTIPTTTPLGGSHFEDYPRVYTLAINDKFTTDAVVDADQEEGEPDGEGGTLMDLIGTQTIYGNAAGGYIKLSTTVPTVGPVLVAIEKTTTPASYGGVTEPAVKFMVIKA